MELRHIRYFLAVAEELNFNRAARRLNMAQPPLSQQIKALEEEMGVRLFNRDRRHVELSAAGAAFHLRAVEILRLVQLATEEARSSQQLLLGQLNVGISALWNHLLPQVIRAFHERAPQAKLNLVDVRLQEHVEALRSSQVDVCFLYPILGASNFLSEQLLTEEGSVALPEGHRFAGRTCLSLADLRDERWIVFPMGTASVIRKLFEQAWKKAGVEPIVAAEMESLEGRLQMVAAGQGISMMPSSLERSPRPGVRFVRLRGDDLKVPVGLIWRKGARSALLDLFLDCSRRATSGVEPEVSACAD